MVVTTSKLWSRREIQRGLLLIIEDRLSTCRDRVGYKHRDRCDLIEEAFNICCLQDTRWSVSNPLESLSFSVLVANNLIDSVLEVKRISALKILRDCW